MMTAPEIRVEVHPFEPFASGNSATLIIGSFPCNNGTNYGNWYYSGSGKSEFWKLLSDIYNMPANTKEEKQNICAVNRIAITDIARSIQRTKGSCSDNNLRIIEYNQAGIEKCLAAGISKILFTSKFVQNHFEELFSNNQIPSATLISPSPGANIYIASKEDYKEMIRNKEVSSPYDYRKINYRKHLGL